MRKQGSFAPIIPELPPDGCSVTIELGEDLPCHYFLDDEGQEDTCNAYLNSISVKTRHDKFRWEFVMAPDGRLFVPPKRLLETH